MLRILCILTTCVLGLASAAAAAPLSLAPDRSSPAAEPEAAPRYASAQRPDLGGGFIEFIFGGLAGGASAPAPVRGEGAMRAPNGPYIGPDGYARRTDPVEQGEPVSQGPIDPKYEPQEVAYDGKEPPGTIVIDTPHRFLFLVEGGGMARRYGIGVGRPGFAWAGVHQITAKREWPDWRPPEEMLKRRPDLPRYMPGGPDNPLGARAMYLGSTLYRIHGSNEPWTIGHAVSSGCIRMRNEDVIDLYGRVKVGTKVVVI
ncbi:MAG TPA: L,D-transpeptidase [Xanthobacteraceae bacterium]|jgi:lipoprotein-anchoring transpeptidase ErfK/SrfK|nr:L,D-transpeptidase [Xanthobacteraceae bacterium]